MIDATTMENQLNLDKKENEYFNIKQQEPKSKESSETLTIDSPVVQIEESFQSLKEKMLQALNKKLEGLIGKIFDTIVEKYDLDVETRNRLYDLLHTAVKESVMLEEHWDAALDEVRQHWLEHDHHEVMKYRSVFMYSNMHIDAPQFQKKMEEILCLSTKPEQAQEEKNKPIVKKQ